MNTLNGILAQSGALTSWVSATDDLQHVAYIGQDGHVYELYMRVGQQPWAYDAPTEISGAPHAQAGAITSWVSATDDLQHVAYISNGQHLHELYMRPGQQPWAFVDISEIAGKIFSPIDGPIIPVPLPELTSWVSPDNVQHIACPYQDYWNWIVEYWMLVGVQPWRVRNPQGTPKIAHPGAIGPVTSWVSAGDNLQHIGWVAWDVNPQGPGPCEYYGLDGPWQFDYAVSIAGSPPGAGAVTSWMSTTDNLQHMAYVGTDGHVYELYMRPGQQPWQWDDMTRIASDH